MQPGILLVRLHVHWLIVLSVLSVCHDHPALHIEFLVPNNAFDRANFSSLMWMLEILSCSYQVNILIELCYFHETSQTFEICLKRLCSDSYRWSFVIWMEGVLYRQCSWFSFMCVCVCVCFTKVWVNYQILKLNGTEKFLVCIDHADLVKIRAYKHMYIVPTVTNNAGILLGASVQIELQIKSAKIKYA